MPTITQADRELLTLANGDRLHKDASDNAHIVQAYIDSLKEKIASLEDELVSARLADDELN